MEGREKGEIDEVGERQQVPGGREGERRVLKPEASHIDTALSTGTGYLEVHK